MGFLSTVLNWREIAVKIHFFSFNNLALLDTLIDNSSLVKLTIITTHIQP